MKNCNICLKDKPVGEFYTRSSRCKVCHKAYNKQHYLDNKQAYLDKAAKRNKIVFDENREKLINFLKENPCVDCGNDDIEVLQFDHIDETTKLYNVADMLTYSWTYDSS